MPRKLKQSAPIAPFVATAPLASEEPSSLETPAEEKCQHCGAPLDWRDRAYNGGGHECKKCHQLLWRLALRGTFMPAVMTVNIRGKVQTVPVRANRAARRSVGVR